MPELRTRLTVVLLTYNCGHRISPVLDRLLALDIPVIAVDNASVDDTRAVLARRPQIQLIALPNNIGAAARNVGAEQAKTPYVVFCDDDGWYEREGLVRAVDGLDRYPQLALVNARILVKEESYLDPISAEMAASPITETHGIPGAVLMSFMGGACVVRVSAYLAVGGYDPEFFMGGEEETLAFKLIRSGWQMRYWPDVVMHHHPSVANAPRLRPFGMRNTLWNAWMHRRFSSAFRYTMFILADTPKNWDWVRGCLLAVRGTRWVLQRRHPMPAGLDAALRMLDERRYRNRRPLFTRHERYGSSRRGAGPTVRTRPDDRWRAGAGTANRP